MKSFRDDFPILNREVKPGVKLVYLDSAATSQKPASVILAMDDYYRTMNANIHRGIHTLAEEATQAYENARIKVQKFIDANNAREIVFTRNATEAINLVAYTWGRKNLTAGDVIVLTEMEHHANLIPWQILAAEKDIRLEFIPVTDEGLLDLQVYRNLLELQPKLVSFTHMSNVLGTINPAKEIIALAHQAGALALVDAAQSIPHFPVSVKDLDADFVAFSAHKMCGPTGIGALYGKERILSEMPPFIGGGDMIRKVALRSFTTNELPYKFEAGTPAIAEGIGFGAAIDYLNSIGMQNIAKVEEDLIAYAIEQVKQIPNLSVLGPPANKKGGVLSMVMEIAHPHDIAQILDEHGIAVRAGHHCAMPLHTRFNIPASTRASFYLYNTREEIDLLVEALKHVVKLFS
jgi:cysteine desulfurase/selenocysteine lyase